jgi:glycosyltransferase involved in cell wall biosynthesis
VSRDRIHFFTLEPDYSLIQDLPMGKVEEASHRFGLDPHRRRLVFSGRLIPLKRVDLLINAFAAIAGERPQWDLVIVGDGPLRDSLAAAVPDALRTRVIWTGFLGDQEDISAVYRACDVLVLPSEREAWALVINEAAAAGLAIVSSSVPGAAEDLVRDGVNGRIFPSGDLGALVDCLLDVTSESRLTAMKAASPVVLDEWRRRADPVDSLRQILRQFGLLPMPRPATVAADR